MIYKQMIVERAAFRLNMAPLMALIIHINCMYHKNY